MKCGCYMASPQCEDGYTRIANELLEALCKANLSPYEWKVLLAVVRLTYGWNKKEKIVSLSQISILTGIRPHHVWRSLRKLKEKELIIMISQGRGRKTRLALQKDYERWKLRSKELLPKQVIPKQVIPTITQIGNKLLPKQVIVAPPKHTSGNGFSEPKDNIKDIYKDTHYKVCVNFCKKFNLTPDFIKPYLDHPSFTRTADIILFMAERGRVIKDPIGLLIHGLNNGLVPPEGYEPFEIREAKKREAYARQKALEGKERQEEEDFRRRYEEARKVLVSIQGTEKYNALLEEAKSHPLAKFMSLENLLINLVARRSSCPGMK